MDACYAVDYSSELNAEQNQIDIDFLIVAVRRIQKFANLLSKISNIPGDRGRHLCLTMARLYNAYYQQSYFGRIFLHPDKNGIPYRNIYVIIDSWYGLKCNGV
jgi:hypothetical protein